MESSLETISNISYYIHLIFFLDNNKDLFLSSIYIYIIFLIFITILFIIMCLRFKAGKYNILWPITILCYALPIISKTFFGQIFLLLISIFKCIYGKTLYYASTTQCEVGTWYYITMPLCCIALLVQIILSYITISLYYQPDFIYDNNDTLKKTNPIPDFIFLLNKILIIIIFLFDKGQNNEHWPILIILCLTTGFNAYVNIYCQNYANEIIKKLNYFFILCLFWGFFCLLISNIFLSINFSGALYFFLCGVLLIFIYCVFYVKTNIDFLNTNFEEIYSINDYLNYIYSYMKLIKEKEISRDSSIILTSFIQKMEDKCTNKKCILKKYLQSLSKGFDSNFLLLQHAQKLFKLALNKSPSNITLKIHYIIFLTSKINQKKSAQKELSSIKIDHMVLYNKFNIFRCKKFIEENNTLVNTNKQEETDSNDIIQEIEYKNNYKEFLKLLSKSSSLYYEFWSSLYTSHLQGTEDFRKLNDIGAELNIIIEQIEKTFEKMRQIKNNDLTVIKLYESYLKNILNNEEKYEKYHKISNNLIIDNKFYFEDKDFTNFDIKNLLNNDEYQFIIISANDDNKGTLINMSLNTCLYFGYTKDEIIGKNMCLLVPELFHKIHNKLFNEVTEKIKTEFFEKLSNKITYIPQCMEYTGYGRNKLKYLIPLNTKIFFAQTEESDLVYIIDLIRKNNLYTNDINETNEIDKNQICCVLTDNNFIIQTFTPNCVELLGLDSKMINANYDITNFIVQFNEELQSLVSTSNKEASIHEASEIISNENSVRDLIVVGDIDKSFEIKLKKKKKLLKLKYSHQRKIIWKINNNINTVINNKKQDMSKILSQFSGIGKKLNGESNKKKLILEVKEVIISNKQIGYYFYFKKSYSGRNEASLLNINESIKMEKIEKPSSIIGKLNKSSVKFYDEEDELPKSSRINDDDIRNNINLNNFQKEEKKTDKNSNISFDLENLTHVRKHESAKILSDFKDDYNDIVDEKFTPKCNFNFYLDLNTKSYKPTSTKDQTNQLYKKLKEQALEKINIVYQIKKKMNKKKSSSNTEISSKEETSNNDDYTSSYLLSSSSVSESKKEESKIKSNNKEISKKNNEKNEINNNNEVIKEKKTKIANIENEYYKIAIAKIKFMIYDFNQEMVITTKSEKKSKVEEIIDNYKLRQNINISEDINYVNLSFDKFVKDTKNKNDKGSNKNINIKNINNKNNEKNNIIDTEKEFEKDIIYALSRQDDQNSIRYFYTISFFYIIIIIIILITEIYFVIKSYNSFKDNLDLLINAINLKYNTNVGIFTIRETTLYSYPSPFNTITYSVPDDNWEKYTEKIYTMSKNAFTTCNSLMENIIGSSVKLSKDTLYILNEEAFNITILYGNNQLRNVTSTLFSSIIQVYSTFCNLLQTETISVPSKNLYNFMYNSFNQIAIALNLQIDLFKEELSDKWTSMIIMIVIYGVVYLLFHILLYIMLTKCFVSISNKKASYISVFYGINLNLIKSSIKKCEFFINKINQNESNGKLKIFDEENSVIMSTSNFNLNNPLKQNNKEKKITRLKKNKGLSNDKRTKRFKIILFVLFLICIILFVAILLSLNLFVVKFIDSSEYLYNLQHYHLNIFELFNGFREYIVDENNILLGVKVYDYLNQKEDEFYKTNVDNLNKINLLRNKISGLSDDFIELNKKGFCSSYIATFKSTKDCEDFVGGKDSILNFDFPFIVNEFVEDIRYGRKSFVIFVNMGCVLGNISFPEYQNVTDIAEQMVKFPGWKVYRLAFFNQFLHTRVNTKFMNIMFPRILEETNISINTIQKNMENGAVIYIILIIVYGAIFLILFWVYWIPLIRTLNMEIYKTKNMLTIIPVQILASLPNIRELLNISNKR